jgi:hypothetical protein
VEKTKLKSGFWRRLGRALNNTRKAVGRAQATAVTFVFYWIFLGPLIVIYRLCGVKFMPRIKAGAESYFRQRKPVDNARERFLRQF